MNEKSISEPSEPKEELRETFRGDFLQLITKKLDDVCHPFYEMEFIKNTHSSRTICAKIAEKTVEMDGSESDERFIDIEVKANKEERIDCTGRVYDPGNVHVRYVRRIAGGTWDGCPTLKKD